MRACEPNLYYFGKMTLGTRSELTNLIDICKESSEEGILTMHSFILGNAKPYMKMITKCLSIFKLKESF